ncbi:4'-phosphopantetheinyl transferase family protein [Nakamurella leprariae]|uniref:4'-phosphopantetheinyl transferase superfamily protein n=1 Tax=Nakamurella leprariae TaxID=2803911 RepID=A0A938YBI0_9ACTN|nr:hypothetical protein [Nakamurella leprariae]MBM9466588.1 hypothetical protein [Nakamurella leprariae]
MAGVQVLVGWAAPDPADLDRLPAGDPVLPRLRRLARPADAARSATVRRVAAEVLAVATGSGVVGSGVIGQRCVRCGADDHGRPVVVGPVGWSVSLAHADAWCLAAVAPRPVGVDVESVAVLAGLDRSGALLSMATRFTDADDRARWAGAPTEERVAGIGAAWVAFEARAKLDGRGLHRRPDEHPPAAPTLALDVGAGAYAAVAVLPDGAVPSTW